MGYLYLFIGRFGFPPNTRFLRPTRVSTANGISTGSAVLAQLLVVTNRQTDTHTDRHTHTHTHTSQGTLVTKGNMFALHAYDVA